MAIDAITGETAITPAIAPGDGSFNACIQGAASREGALPIWGLGRPPAAPAGGRLSPPALAQEALRRGEPPRSPHPSPRRFASGDRIELHVQVPGSSDRVYVFTQLISADHQSVGMGPEGGTFTSLNAEGTPLATINVMTGSFDGSVIISLKPGDPAQTAPVPDGFTASAPVAITLSEPAKKEIALILPTPAGWNASDPAQAFWLVSTADVGGAAPRKAPMVLDTLTATACPGASGSCLATNSPPFPGLIASGQYQIYQVAASAWGFFSGTFAPAGGGGEMFVSCAQSPFVFMMNDTFGFNWVLPVPMQAPAAGKAASGYTITVTDNSTGEVLVTITRTDPPDPGKPTDLGISTNIPTRPYLMAGSPFKALPFQLQGTTIQDSGNPAVSFQILLASHADAHVTAPVGTAAAGSGAVVTVTCGGQTAYAPVLPDGSFDFTLGTLHNADLSAALDLRPSLTSGQTLSVSYAPATGTGTATASVTVPSQPVTDKLNLTIAQGNLTLQAQGGFGDGGVLRLYDAMATSPQFALGGPQAASGLAMDLSSFGLSTGDVLFYTLSTSNIDPGTAITATFDSSLKAAPAAWEQTTDPTGPAVRLVDVADAAHPLPVAVTPGGGLRMLTITPGVGLKAGSEYELQLWNLQGASGNGFPAGQPVVARFTVQGTTDLGSVAFNEVYDIARRGSILYMAVGDQGYDVVDASDPTAPQSMINGPVAEGGINRSVAIAENVPVAEGSASNPRTVMVLAGGGATQGTIRLHYADFPEDTQDQTPSQTAAIGTFIGGAKLCDAVGSGTGNEGTPTMVRTLGTTGFVSTVGVGLQVVDLTKILATSTNVIVNTLNKYGSKDISMIVKGVAVMPAPAGQSSIPAFVLASVLNYGVVAWNASNTAMAPAGEVRFSGCANFSPSGSLRLNAYPGYAYTQTQADGTQVPMTTNLVLMAGGSAGLVLFEAVPGTTALGLTLKAVVPTPGEAYDVAMDTRRGIAYVACYNAGVAEVDLRDPYAHPIPAQGCGDGSKPYGLWDENGDGQDDRITGVLAAASDSRSTIVVDSETGIVYVGEQGASAGLKVRGAQQPRMEFVLDKKDAQGNPIPGQYNVPGYLSAFDGDKPRLALWLPGGAGTQITGATVQLYDRKGFEETPAQDAAGNNVVSTVYRGSVTLTRASAKRTESKYNFYVEAPNEITLGMIYDPANPDPTLMVSKQSGNIKGIAIFNGWKGWATNPSVIKPVSRPWVEWTNDQLVSNTTQESTVSVKQGLSESSDFLPPDYQGPTMLAKNQARDITVHYHDQVYLPRPGGISDYYPATLYFTFSDSSVGVFEPASRVATSDDIPALTFRVTGSTLTANPSSPAKLRITAVYRNNTRALIHEIPVWVFEAGMAVDYNRDGSITFDGQDAPTKAKPYEFWVNNNSDGYDPDIDALSDLNSTVWAPDSADHIIGNVRDLEDFSRLWVLSGRSNLGANAGKLSYKVHFLSGTTARANLFGSVEPDGGLKYLQEPATAQAQVSGDFTHFLCEIKPTMALSELPSLPFGATEKNYCLFEGVSTGKSDIMLEVLQGTTRIGTYSVPMRLRDIKDFYEMYSVGSDPSVGVTSLAQVWRYPDDTTLDNTYILFVHGWNWEEWREEAFAATTFKRLWWEGYKGRLGLFQWPANFALPWSGNCVGLACGQNFDLSEYNAWMSGQGLEALLKTLNVSYPGKVYLVAHSQGNVVSAEALKEATEDSAAPNPIVAGYLAMQGAISASYYDSSALDYGQTIKNPNVAGQYPNGDSTTPSPYLASVVRSTVPLVNFYNPGDYALVGDVIGGLNWKWNNNRKPDMGYGYNASKNQFYWVDSICVDPSDPMTCRHDFDFTDRDQSFRAFSYAVESWALPIGATPMSLAANPQRFINVRLDNAPYSLTGSHADHDGQFVSDMATRWAIWSQALKVLAIPFDQTHWPPR